MILQATRLQSLQRNSGFYGLSKISPNRHPNPSPCTSRNLNLNSFCNLTDDTSMAKWKPSIQATYENISKSPSYVRELSGPMRLVHPDWMAEKELITSLTKVFINQLVVQWEPHFSFYRENTTTPLRRTLQLWTSSLGSQPCLVSSYSIFNIYFANLTLRSFTLVMPEWVSNNRISRN